MANRSFFGDSKLEDLVSEVRGILSRFFNELFGPTLFTLMFLMPCCRWALSKALEPRLSVRSFVRCSRACSFSPDNQYVTWFPLPFI